MKKTIWISALVLGGFLSAFAEEWITFAGRVVKVQHGKAANFYTIIADDGQEYHVNSMHVKDKEELFAKAYEKNYSFTITFCPHPTSKEVMRIWRIREFNPVAAPAAE